MANLVFIGLPRRNVVTLNQFVKTVIKRDDVDLTHHKKILKKCGYKFLNRRTAAYNELILWLGYYRELRNHRPDVSPLRTEFHRLCCSICQHVKGHSALDMTRVDVKATVSVLEHEQKNLLQDLSRGAIVLIMEAITSLCRMIVYGKLSSGCSFEFVNMRGKDMALLEENIGYAERNMFQIQPLRLDLDNKRNPHIVNSGNKMMYIGRLILAVLESWEALETKCLSSISGLCQSLRSELREIGTFDCQYINNILKTRVNDGVACDDLLNLLTEDFHLYETAFPLPLDRSKFSFQQTEPETTENAFGSWYRSSLPESLLADLKDPAVRYKVFDIREPTERHKAFEILSDDDEKPDYSQKKRDRDSWWEVDSTDDSTKKASALDSSGLLDLEKQLEKLDVGGVPTQAFVFEPPFKPTETVSQPFAPVSEQGDLKTSLTPETEEVASVEKEKKENEEGEDEDDEESIETIDVADKVKQIVDAIKDNEES
ncbi:tegument protein pp150 [Saimiriine betaherpesvirus 4]|uniref:Tegument protein pp150 n=1 Tax=Saimiriine betaherpesvirus 4 TaxID=1535247 RepID=G8XSU6_9BETA|nr:tegument protein pp150 [Saimiriine betaherpesvirus 4]AEV80893.1 tegument protein pp150 [Saimiriine betaherpesvirus 4]